MAAQFPRARIAVTTKSAPVARGAPFSQEFG
jgi:hypothetical protein